MGLAVELVPDPPRRVTQRSAGHARRGSDRTCSHHRSPRTMRIATVIGNRPQFVKAAAVSRPLRERHEELIVNTGQHYDDELSRVFFDELDVPAPAVELGIGDGSSTSQTWRMLKALEPVLADMAPDLVLVYGDTNSTLAGALAAAQRGVPGAPGGGGLRALHRGVPGGAERGVTHHAPPPPPGSTGEA